MTFLLLLHAGSTIGLVGTEELTKVLKENKTITDFDLSIEYYYHVHLCYSKFYLLVFL